jgi:ankyrin repeat protein
MAIEGKENVLKEWIDAKTYDEEFTCLHFAVFRGNIKICKLLIDFGADLLAINKQGLNVMHLAA